MIATAFLKSPRPPWHGVLTLSDVGPTHTIICESCWRSGRYNVERLVAEHGADAKLPDLLGDARSRVSAREIFDGGAIVPPAAAAVGVISASGYLCRQQ